MMNYREKIRKAIECPQFGNYRYGVWGALTFEQRRDIKRLLDELDGADDYVRKLYEEKQELITYLKEKIKERNRDIKLIGKDVYTSKYAYEEILSKIEKVDEQ